MDPPDIAACQTPNHHLRGVGDTFDHQFALLTALRAHNRNCFHPALPRRGPTRRGSAKNRGAGRGCTLAGTTCDGRPCPGAVAVNSKRCSFIRLPATARRCRRLERGILSGARMSRAKSPKRSGPSVLYADSFGSQTKHPGTGVQRRVCRAPSTPRRDDLTARTASSRLEAKLGMRVCAVGQSASRLCGYLVRCSRSAFLVEINEGHPLAAAALFAIVRTVDDPLASATRCADSISGCAR